MTPTLAGPARTALATAAFLAALVPHAMAQDVEGAKDHPLLGRYEGATITYYTQTAYDELRLPAAKITRANVKDPGSWQIDLSGRVTRIRFEGPPGRSPLEVMRNYQKALEQKGFEIRYFCREAECAEGSLADIWDAGRGKIGLTTNWNTSIYMLAQRTEGGQKDTIGLLAVETGGNLAREPQIAATIVEGEAMETDKITVVEASEMEQAIARDGRIAIYGIQFDFDKADLKPESQPQIDQLGALLSDNPEMEILIVGHTDGQGSMGYNLELSQARAQAVAARLSSGYGIDQGRMTAAGAGMMAPVASNRTEDGRAKNRRVEIVEIYRQE
ncbi:OmpA family protein [Amorphus orientalis]|uniref:Outer membrane protein OmpA-like peptidoglycan-associated protein n=1 Tax=Amorphus orientalis TaxID=649198 RepID=A0AAE3VP20_9HYPH|nr:OmpA family protein [Amorphus orientalis]MDQ0315649.1 outer membrane protein OmpA-like peptidoglycan-associated protein [Amorphus orientalis]